MNPIDWEYELRDAKDGVEHQYQRELEREAFSFCGCAVGEAKWDGLNVKTFGSRNNPEEWKPETPVDEIIRIEGIKFNIYICSMRWSLARECRLKIRARARRIK